MTDHNRSNEPESYRWQTEPPIPGWDLGQRGWPAVMVTRSLAGSVVEYCEGRDMTVSEFCGFDSNALVGAEPDDEVLEVVYMTDGPLSDPKTAYPFPESRIACMDISGVQPKAASDPEERIDTPRKSVVLEVLEKLMFAEIDTDKSGDDLTVYQLARESGLDERTVADAREMAETLNRELSDQMALSDAGGPTFSKEPAESGDAEDSDEE